MPLTICSDCDALFVVGSPEEAGGYGRCPRCGKILEPAPAGRTGERRQREAAPPPDREPGGEEAPPELAGAYGAARL